MTRFQHLADTLLQQGQRGSMLANRQNDEAVPNGVTSPSKPIDPRPNAVICRSPGMCCEETFGEMGSVEDETEDVRYEGWEDGCYRETNCE